MEYEGDLSKHPSVVGVGDVCRGRGEALRQWTVHLSVWLETLVAEMPLIPLPQHKIWGGPGQQLGSAPGPGGPVPFFAPVLAALCLPFLVGGCYTCSLQLVTLRLQLVPRRPPGSPSPGGQVLLKIPLLGNHAEM